MINFGESDSIIEISKKLDKSNTYTGFCNSNNISFFI